MEQESSGGKERIMKEYIIEFGDALYNEETGEVVFNSKIISELIRCKHCKHCVRVEIWGTSYLECEHYTPKMVDETDWCCWGERDDENGNVER